MPILEKETSIYPANLLSEDTSTDTERRWWAIFTKSRQEKALARELRTYEVPFYLPLVAKDNLIRGRRVTSFIPLFTGYVFLFGGDEERVQTLKTNRVSRILPVNDGDQLRFDLHNLSHLIETDVPLTVERRLAAGRRVRIKSGPMLGLEGTVTERRGRRRLLVAVRFLQSGVSIEIDDFMLEPID